MRHVTVVGGGVIGLCTAWELHKRGARVTVLEARGLGTGASWGNAGWIVPSLSAPVPAPGLVRASLKWMVKPDSPLYLRPRFDVQFARWLLGFWRACRPAAYRAGLEATAELNRRTMDLFDGLRADGVDFEMHRDGILFAYEALSEMEHDLEGVEQLRAIGYERPEQLVGDAVRECEPALSDGIAGGYLIGNERHVRPETLTAGLVARLTASAVELRANEPVTGLETARGRVTEVVTVDLRLPTDAVVIAAGAWTPRVARMVGVHMPIEAGKGYSLDYSPPPTRVRRPLYLHEARVAVTPFAGMVRLAGTMELSGLNERVDFRRVGAIARAGARLLKDWPSDAGAATAWTGMRPLTPDGLPIIGLVPGFRNLAIASGHAMLGVTLAPATAVAVADLLTTGRLSATLQPFDPARFR